MYRIVEAYYHDAKDVTVRVVSDDVKAVVTSMDRPVAVMHGDFIKASSPQGIVDWLRKAEDIWPKATSMYMGHFHRQMSLPLVQRFGERWPRFLYVNGTASIDDEYLARMGSSPTLAWWMNFSNPKRETATYSIGLYQDGITRNGRKRPA
jgi:hypothetical protein